MVPCLVTLTDLYTRRAGLSASAELLVLGLLDSCGRYALFWVLCWFMMIDWMNYQLSVWNTVSQSQVSLSIYGILLFIRLFSLTMQCNVIIAGDSSDILDSIVKLRSQLSEIIEPDFGLLDELLKLGVLTRKQYSDIRIEVRAAYRRADDVIDLLTSEEQCKNFLTALRCTQQHHVVNLIEQRGGHHFISVQLTN